MRIPNYKTSKLLPAIAIVLLLVPMILSAQSPPGIPEPGLTLYGVVNNTAAGGARLTSGTLVWTIQPPTGSPILVTVNLVNINDQFSYVLRVPFESVPAGFTLSANALALPSASTSYTRTATINNQPATIVAPAPGSFSFSSAERGRLERVDLTVATTVETYETWAQRIFGRTNNRNEDPDGDGVSNYNEFVAGTDPLDKNSLFKVILIQPAAPGGILIEWSSVAGKSYSIERSASLLTGFAPLLQGVAATAPMNSYRDATATGSGPYFYRLRVQ
jgi:hypothetical protein